MKIMLDPGHGGQDPGATAHGIQEKDVNLLVALGARDLLQAHQGIEVTMTRAGDTDMSLPERTDLANNLGAAAFVSIHHNAAAGNLVARGVEIYHSIIGGKGKQLAEMIHTQYRVLIPELPSRGMRTRAGEGGRDYYHVIRATTMPAVIIEGAFITNPADAALIKSQDFLNRQARAISQGILGWMGKEAVTLTGTPLIGPPQATATQAQEWAKDRGAHQRFIDIAPEYWRLGRVIGIRPEVAYAQAAKETAFGRYGGAVAPEQNNWAGIKTATAAGDRPQDHETFPTPEDGVRAHFNHLAAYVGLEPIGQTHGRYAIVNGLSWAGIIRTVEELGARWAPAGNYGESIVRDFLVGLLATAAPEQPSPDQRDQEIAKLKTRIKDLEERLAAIRALAEPP